MPGQFPHSTEETLVGKELLYYYYNNNNKLEILGEKQKV